MKRNQNVELLRGWSVLVILVYHYGGLSGVIAGGQISRIMECLVQLSMISFFVISGFGTWCYLERKKHKMRKVEFSASSFTD